MILYLSYKNNVYKVENVNGGGGIVTDRSSVLPFCPNRTEQVNKSSVFRTETEQNRTCKNRIKT